MEETQLFYFLICFKRKKKHRNGGGNSTGSCEFLKNEIKKSHKNRSLEAKWEKIKGKEKHKKGK